MKLRPILPFALASLVSAPASAAPESAAPAPSTSRRNAIQADLGLAVVGLAYERVVHDRVAVQVEAQVFGIWWADPKFRGFGGQLRPSFFLTDVAPHGVYLAPFVRVDRVQSSADGPSGTGVGWSAGAFVGYSFLFGDAVNLRLGAGAQYMSYAVDAGPIRIEWKKPYPALDLVVGYAF